MHLGLGMDPSPRCIFFTGRGRWAADGQRLNTFYQIPYRCLVPLNVDNLLVAGRQVSADPAAFGASGVFTKLLHVGDHVL